MPPLPLDPEGRVPPLNCAAKRVTMDFSLLSVPQFDLLQDSDCDNDKQAAGQRADGNHEENIPIQVFCLTFVTLHQREPFGYNCTVQQICDLMISTTDLCSSLETKTYSTLWFADICTIQPKSSQSSPQHSSLLGVPHQGVCVLFTNADGVLTS